MGTWGTGIFDDDIAADVRDTYRDLLGDRVDDDLASRQVLADFTEDGEVPSIVLLALAAAQRQVGRLTDETRLPALEVIDAGTDLQRWADATPIDQRRRTAALTKLRGQLTGPQPSRRTVRRPWRPTTDLVPGDVLAVRLPTDDVRLLRTVLIEEDRRAGSWPMLELLDHRGVLIPDLPNLEALPAAHRTTPTGYRRPQRWIVTPNHKGEPDWREAGLALVGRIQQRPGDPMASTQPWTSWPALREQLASDEWA